MSGNLRILADSAIAAVAERGAAFGEVVTAPGTEITRALLRETSAQVLLVRSVTRINSELLAGTDVRFVATATAGVDHVDEAWLRTQGIGFSNAPGCNAPAVVHWVLTALVLAAQRSPKWVPDGPIGIVGHGQVGGRLVRKLTALGLPTLVCDPPQAAAGGGTNRTPLVSLSQVLSNCKYVTLHVPLTTQAGSSHPTAAMVHPGLGYTGCLINTSRGSVCTPEFVDQAPRNSLVLDVWPQEPELPWGALQRPDSPILLASPHVAGYSRVSKQRATSMTIDALAQFLGVPKPAADKDEAVTQIGELDLRGCRSALDACAAVVGSCCAIEADNAKVHGLAALPTGERVEEFEAMRRSYHLREQPSSLQLSPELWRQLHPWRDQAVFAGGPPLSRVLEVFGFPRSEPSAPAKRV